MAGILPIREEQEILTQTSQSEQEEVEKGIAYGGPMSPILCREYIFNIPMAIWMNDLEVVNKNENEDKAMSLQPKRA